jgi:3-dehydroquinate dehydratase/shikimate dehydrogenase
LTMGFDGLMSRILSPAWGGFLTFGSLQPEERTAPGQITAQELHDLYRVPALSAETAVAGVIGHSVQHSLSPRLHNAAYRRLGLDWVYVPLLVRDLKPFMNDFVIPGSRQVEWNLRGLSVTIPHKVEIVSYLSGLDWLAREVGAVNTVVVKQGKLIGYNTDVEGAMRPLRQRLSLNGTRAVLLGAGGAARAVGVGLKKEGADVLILARDVSRARALAQRLGVEAGALSDLANAEYDVLINATPLGMGDSQEETPAPAHGLRPGKIVFDLVARLESTRFLRQAQAVGCTTINGLEMLVHQAAMQFELWTQQEPPIEIMFEAVSAMAAQAADGSNSW